MNACDRFMLDNDVLLYFREMMLECDNGVFTLGLEERTAGFHENVDNLPPTAERIVHEVEKNNFSCMMAVDMG